MIIRKPNYKPAYFIREWTGTEGLFLSNISNGIILDKKEIENLIKGLQFTLLHYEETGINKINKETLIEEEKARYENNHRCKK